MQELEIHSLIPRFGLDGIAPAAPEEEDGIELAEAELEALPLTPSGTYLVASRPAVMGKQGTRNVVLQPESWYAVQDCTVYPLEDADLVRANAGALLLAAPRKPLAGDPHDAAVGLVEAGEAGEKGRLPRPGGPGHGDDLPGGDAQLHPPQRERLVVPGVVEAIEALNLQRRAHRDHRRELVTIRHGSTLSAPLGPESVRTARRPRWKNA